jgi:phospholipid/cholesterol/gamma-HCH transport system substrate-binding protein
MTVLDSTLKSITILTEKASLLIDANHESITSASGNIDTLSQTLNAQRKHFEDIVNNMKSFSEGLIESDIDKAVLQVDETMSSLDLVLKDVNSGRGSLGKFIKDGDFYSEMNESMTQLELLLKDMRENPKRYVHFSLFGRKGSGSSKDSIK